MLALIKSRLLARRRARAIKKVGDPAFRKLLTGNSDDRLSWRKHDYLAVDIETTGLDPQTDEVVSFGWVPIVNARIQTGQAVRIMVRTKVKIDDSAKVHGIRHQDMSEGIKLEAALAQLLEALQQKVLLVHYSGLDKVLLDRLCKQLYGAKLWVPLVDTLEIARHQFRHDTIEPGQLRLMALCERFGLPKVRQHDALNDALATAQLFLALVCRTNPEQEASLGEIMF